MWIWICTSKDTDIEREKRSYIIGAVYVSGIVKTKEYRKKYKKERAKGEYTHSKEDAYQCIIPMCVECRRELKHYIGLHEYKKDGGENRQHGIWRPKRSAPLYKLLKEPLFES